MRIETKKILCAIDFSDFSDTVLDYGKSLASELGSTLYLCHILSGTLMISSLGHSYVEYPDIEAERAKSATDKLEKMAEQLDIKCEIIVSTGHVPDEINKIAGKNNIDLVIAATHGGSGIKRFLIGSVTDRLVKILQCPLLVLFAQQKNAGSVVEKQLKFERILVGCDFSPDSQLAFDHALSLAQEFQTQLHLAHVIRPMEQIELHAADHIPLQEDGYTNWSRPEYLELQKKAVKTDSENQKSLFESLKEKLSSMVPEDSRNWCTPITILLNGQPYKELVDYAEQTKMDMIVLGVHGHGLLERFLVGSTTERVISRACCPVLVVRQIV